MAVLFRLKKIESKIKKCEVISAKIKAFNFVNMQSFDSVYENYEVGEVYIIKGIGYTIVTKKNENEIEFLVIMRAGSLWGEHWQDVDKILKIKQGIYLDLYTGKEYKDLVKVKAYDPSYFKSIGEEDLIIKGKIYKNETK